MDSCEIIRYTKCYLQPHDSVSTSCDCHKRYFKVFIDFKPIYIEVCKDWFNMRYNEISIGGNNKSICRIKDNYTYIYIAIIDEIVNEMFGGYFSYMKEYNSNIGWINITLSMRPYKYININVLSLLEYFHTKEISYYSINVYKRVVNICLEYIKKYSKYKVQYSKAIKICRNNFNAINDELITILFETLINKKYGSNQ